MRLDLVVALEAQLLERAGAWGCLVQLESPVQFCCFAFVPWYRDYSKFFGMSNHKYEPFDVVRRIMNQVAQTCHSGLLEKG